MNTLEIALGALLHDVGKFSQRAHREGEGLGPQSKGMTPMLCPTGRHGGPTHIHVLYTNEFVENLPFLPPEMSKSRVANLAAYHHRPDTAEQEIITRADRLSSGMECRALDEDQASARPNYRRVRLHSVASTVSIPESAPSHPLPLPLVALSATEAFPIQPSEGDLTEQYQKLWRSFQGAWAANRCPSPIGFIDRSLSILENLTWCIPSATNAVPDVSLFDHLKTTAAIAVCLAEAPASQAEPFLLVAADLTGIQKFLFGIKAGTGGLARRLRARSFQVAAYLESVSLSLLHRLELPLTQRILFAGGKFHMLLPNTDQVHAALRSLTSDVSRWLFDVSSAEVGLALASLPIGEEGLRDFSTSVTRLNGRLRAARDRAGEALLIHDGQWKEDAFILPGIGIDSAQDLCDACGKRAGSMQDAAWDRTRLCDHCAAEVRLGRDLPHARYVAFYLGENRGHVAPDGGFVMLGDKEKPEVTPRLLVDLDGLTAGVPEMPVVTGLRSRYVPIDETTGSVVMFEDLAQRSIGRPALGYLKMDVDNLGYLFSQGLKGRIDDTGDADDDRTSISRVAALSRTLETYFSGYMERLLRQQFPNIYVIYAGGDDLAAVGPWNEMFDVAQRIRDEFQRYTGANPAWTLSAGLAVVNLRVPVLIAIEEADRLLDTSKHAAGAGVLPWPLSCTSEGAVQKDRITSFYTSIPWAEYKPSLAQAKQLLAWLEEGVVNTAKVRRLLQYAEMARRFQETGDARQMQYMPYLARDLRRNWPQGTPAERDARQWAATLALPDSEAMKRAIFVCEYALCGYRGKAGG